MEGRLKKLTTTSTSVRWWQKIMIKNKSWDRPWLDCFWQAGLHYAKQKNTTEVENKSAQWMHTPSNHVWEWNMVPQQNTTAENGHNTCKMEWIMMGLTLHDRKSASWICSKTSVIDVIHQICTNKHQWAGHV